jgi:NitT/TauT family transport system permease protein
MAVDASVLAEQLAGLDALELALGRPRRRGAYVWAALWPKATAIAIVLGAWQAVVMSGWRPTYVLPAPATVFGALGHLVTQGIFWSAVLTTMRRGLTGYALAVGVGALLGLAVARVRPLRAALGSLITGLQTMPSIAWFPFAILLFKLSESAILFVVVLGAAPSIANGVVNGVDHVPPLLLRAGRTIGARGFALYRHVLVPAAFPSFLGGLKQGWAFAWRSLMAGELLVIVAHKPSLGSRLQFAREFSDAPLLIALMLVVLIVGIAIDLVFVRMDVVMRERWGLVDRAT